MIYERPRRGQFVAATIASAVLWLALIGLMLFVLFGCKSADGAQQPSCLYMCQAVTVEQPALPAVPEAETRRARR